MRYKKPLNVMILQLLNSGDKFRFSEIHTKLNKADSVVARELKKLVKKDMVKKTGSKKKGGIYYSFNRDSKDAIFLINKDRTELKPSETIQTLEFEPEIKRYLENLKKKLENAGVAGIMHDNKVDFSLLKSPPEGKKGSDLHKWIVETVVAARTYEILSDVNVEIIGKNVADVDKYIDSEYKEKYLSATSDFINQIQRASVEKNIVKKQKAAGRELTTEELLQILPDVSSFRITISYRPVKIPFKV